MKVALTAKPVIDSKGFKKTRISIDGSRQKRGQTAMNGVATVVSGDKRVDVKVLTKHFAMVAKCGKLKKVHHYINAGYLNTNEPYKDQGIEPVKLEFVGHVQK